MLGCLMMLGGTILTACVLLELFFGSSEPDPYDDPDYDPEGMSWTFVRNATSTDFDPNDPETYPDYDSDAFLANDDV